MAVSEFHNPKSTAVVVEYQEPRDDKASGNATCSLPLPLKTLVDQLLASRLLKRPQANQHPQNGKPCTARSKKESREKSNNHSSSETLLRKNEQETTTAVQEIVNYLLCPCGPAKMTCQYVLKVVITIQVCHHTLLWSRNSETCSVKYEAVHEATSACTRHKDTQSSCGSCIFTYTLLELHRSRH